MSVRTVFESNSVEYLLPAAGAAGSVMAMGGAGAPTFGEFFTTTCTLGLQNSQPVPGVVLTLQQIGPKVDMYLSGPILSVTVDSPTFGGNLTDLEEAIPASLIPVRVGAIGNVAFQVSTGASAPLMVQACILGSTTARPGEISFIYKPEIPPASYLIGSEPSLEYNATSIFVGSYLLE